MVCQWERDPGGEVDERRSVRKIAFSPDGRSLISTEGSAVLIFEWATGLVCRPVRETVADTWAWLREIGGRAPQRPDRLRKGLDPEVEARVLAAGFSQHIAKPATPLGVARAIGAVCVA